MDQTIAGPRPGEQLYLLFEPDGETFVCALYGPQKTPRSLYREYVHKTGNEIYLLEPGEEDRRLSERRLLNPSHDPIKGYAGYEYMKVREHEFVRWLMDEHGFRPGRCRVLVAELPHSSSAQARPAGSQRRQRTLITTKGRPFLRW